MTRRAMLRYVENQDRWFADIGKEMFSLHCGEEFQMHVGHKKVNCRIEMGQTWYVFVDDVPLGLMKNKDYLISIDL